jgi:hypothetical protein
LSVDGSRPKILIYKSSHLQGLIFSGMSLLFALVGVNSIGEDRVAVGLGFAVAMLCLYSASVLFRSARTYLKLDFDGIELSSPIVVMRFPWSDIARFERCRIQNIEAIRIRFRHPEATDRIITNLYRATLDEMVVELEHWRQAIEAPAGSGTE